jgi:hypothetical protein
MWSRNKIALSGIFAATMVLFQLMALITVSIFGIGSGGPFMAFFAPLTIVLGRMVVGERGSILLICIIYVLLVTPFPAVGPPGFLPKIPLVIAAATLSEVIFALFERMSELAGALTGGFLSLSMIVGVVYILQLFNVAGTSEIMELGVPLYILVFLEGAAGGFLGQKLSCRVKDRKALKRFKTANK